MVKTKKLQMKCYSVKTPMGKKWTEALDKKQVKNLRIAGFKLKLSKRKCM